MLLDGTMSTPMLFTRIAEHCSLAAQGGSPGVSRIQLAWCGPYPSPHNKCLPKIFSYGDRNGREEVVRILPERNDANVNKTNARGKTPLSHINPSIANTKLAEHHCCEAA